VIENPYCSQEGHGPYELHEIGDLDLEEGGTICGCRLAVATHGKLNAAQNKVYIGKGRALDCL
jgi:homoserine O-acetyltransferase